MKFIWILLVTSILLIVFGELIRIDFGNDIFLKPLDLFVSLTAFSYLGYKIIKRERFPKSELTKSILIFIGVAIVSLLINSSYLTADQFLVAFLYWLRFTSLLTVYFIILDLDMKSSKKIPIILYLSGFILFLGGVVQYIFYPNLRNLYYLGWDEHNYRLFSSFLDPNFAGVSLTLFFVFLSVMIKTSSKYKYLLIAVAVLTFVSIFLTYSRSALLMLVTIIVTYLLLVNKKRWIFSFIIFATIGMVLISSTFTTENTNLFRTTSSFARIDSYKKAIDTVIEYPVFGVGFNAYRYLQVGGVSSVTKSKYQDHAGSGVDSSLLFVAATTGIVGFVAYVYLWYKIIKNAFSIYYRYTSRLSLIVICSCIGLLVNSLFINSLFYPPVLLWLWVVVGLMDKEFRN